MCDWSKLEQSEATVVWSLTEAWNQTSAAKAQILSVFIISLDYTIDQLVL